MSGGRVHYQRYQRLAGAEDEDGEEHPGSQAAEIGNVGMSPQVIMGVYVGFTVLMVVKMFMTPGANRPAQSPDKILSESSSMISVSLRCGHS